LFEQPQFRAQRKPVMKRLTTYSLLSALLVLTPLQALAMGKVPPAPAPARTPAPAGLQERRGPANADSRSTPREIAPPHFSKFEARRIRHACVGRANDRGLRGGERSAYLSRCYFGRVAHRGLRLVCQKEAAAKALDRAAQREFVRECVRERAREKDAAADAAARPKEATTKPER
jgi:hypothetical protein